MICEGHEDSTVAAGLQPRGEGGCQFENGAKLTVSGEQSPCSFLRNAVMLAVILKMVQPPHAC